MGLPDLDSASTWGGKLLVDRDGTDIGTCTQIFLDDATGLPEWAQADLSGGPGVVPLMDATESGDRVRVAVPLAAVEDAPRVEDPVHISFEEEERLYRHYGITFSQAESESLLPVTGPADEPAVTEPAVTEPAVTESAVTESAVTESAVTESVTAEPVTAQPPVTESRPAVSTPSMTSPREFTPPTSGQRSGLVPALAAGAVGVLAVIAAAVFWWRRQHQVPPTRKDLLVARARAASLALGTRTDQVRTSAAPLLETGRRLSASAAQRAAVEAGAAAERAAVQARAAAQQAAALAATARAAGMQRVLRADGDSATDRSADEHQRRDAIMSALQAFGGFAAGYTLRARSGGRDQRQRD